LIGSAEKDSKPLAASGGVYEVKTKASQVGNKTRGIKIQPKSDGKTTPAEFSGTVIGIKTFK
jgi:hypothetical protein